MIRLVAAALVAAAMAGCTAAPTQVNLTYFSTAPTAADSAGRGLPVEVVGIEGRQTDADRIGVELSTIGTPSAPIYPNQNVPDYIRYAMATELQRIGFRIGPSPVRVTVRVQRFYAEFTPDFPHSSVDGQVMLVVQVIDGHGRVVATRHISGRSNIGGLAYSPDPAVATRVLEQALSSTFARLMSDSTFIRAMFEADAAPRLPGPVLGGPPPAAVAPPLEPPPPAVPGGGGPIPLVPPP